MIEKKLKNTPELHKKWLNDGIEGQKADLRGANLAGTNLRRADLQEADLRRADLYRADLEEADLRKADLKEADLMGTNLRKADLREADLRGVDLRKADLRKADLRGTKIDYCIEDGLLKKVAENGLRRNALHMNDWHTCETTHCIAGWACHLAENGREFETQYGTQIAGLLLLGEEAHSHFFDDNQKAKEYLKEVLKND